MAARARVLTWDRAAVLALLCVLVLAQGWFSQIAASRVYYEELAESVRNPVWLADGRVYDGVSSNVGWYATVAVAYKLAGFSLLVAKAVRLVLHAVGLACLTHLLVAWMGWRRSIVPLAAIGLSPVALYFGSLSTSYGSDLDWAPIVAWLLWIAARSGGAVGPLVYGAAGFCAMWAALMWPACVFFIPAWGACYFTFRRVYGGSSRHGASPAAIVIGAALPFAWACLWLDNLGTWLYDPVTGSGVFRGGAGSLVDSPSRIVVNIGRVAIDLVQSGSSYYYSLRTPDLAGPAGWVAASAVVAWLPRLLRDSRHRGGLLTVTTSAFVVLAVLGISDGPPGLRRGTYCLAVFYVLFAVAWKAATEARNRPALRVAAVALSMLALHHAAVLVGNAAGVKEHPPDRPSGWFSVAATPDGAARHWLAHVERGNPLDCRQVPGEERSCRYAETVAAIKALGRTAAVADLPIDVYDPDGDRVVTVSPSRWPFGSRR